MKIFSRDIVNQVNEMNDQLHNASQIKSASDRESLKEKNSKVAFLASNLTGEELEEVEDVIEENKRLSETL